MIDNKEYTLKDSIVIFYFLIGIVQHVLQHQGQQNVCRAIYIIYNVFVFTAFTFFISSKSVT